jgi:nitrogen fixation protein FixH
MRGHVEVPPGRRITGGYVLAAMLAFFGLVIAVNGYMIHRALATFPGVEVPSSYRAGKEFGQVAAAAAAQAARGWDVAARVERDGAGAARLSVEPRDRAGARVVGLDVAARLQWPPDRRRDVALTLDEPAAGVYVGRVDDVAAGQWDLLIEARERGEVVYRSRNRIVLR